MPTRQLTVLSVAQLSEYMGKQLMELQSLSQSYPSAIPLVFVFCGDGQDPRGCWLLCRVTVSGGIWADVGKHLHPSVFIPSDLYLTNDKVIK